MSAREVHVTFYNCTDSILTLTSTDKKGGEWVDNPPDTIYPGQTVYWRTDSDGFMTGTEAYAYYQTTDGVSIEVYWDNPYGGTDKSAIYFNGNEASDDYTYYGGYQTQRGNVEYITFTACQYRPNWMDQRWYNGSANYKTTPLRDLMLPGTHDSGTYAITSSSYMSPDASDLLKDLGSFEPSLVSRWCKTQNLNTAQQLNAGIRYFDIRVVLGWNEGELWIAHGMYAINIDAFLSDVADFVKSNPHEIIILDFNHFYQFEQHQHDSLVGKISAALGDRLAPSSLGTGATPSDLWNQNKQIIVNYTYYDSDLFDSNPWLWNNCIRSYWPNTDDLGTLQSDLNSELSNKPTDQFWVMQCILSINENDYGWITKHAALDTYPYSLLAWEGTTNATMLPIIASDAWSNAKVNIVMADAITYAAGFVDTVISRYTEYNFNAGSLIWTSAYGDNINNLGWQPPAQILSASSIAAPALAGYFQDTVWLVNADNSGNANMWFAVFDAGSGWQAEWPIPKNYIDHPPALAAFNGQLWCVYRGWDTDNNLYWITYDGNTGNTWSPPQQITGNTSPSGPAIAAMGDQLFCVYRGMDNNLYCIAISAGQQKWGSPIAISGNTTVMGPSLAVFYDRLWCVYRGRDNDNLYTATSANGQSWILPAAYAPNPGQRSDAQPALTYYYEPNVLVCAFRGIGNDTQLYSTYTAGNDWSAPQPIIGCNSKTGPALAAYGRIYCAYRA